MITVRYSSVDRYRESRTFKTLAAAQKFASKWVGQHPEIGRGYAVSDDGIGKVVVTGCTLAELFPAPAAAVEMDRDFEGCDDAHDAHDDDRSMFADPGGKSALRAATRQNPRNLPCPTCERPNALTPADKAQGYQCDLCAEREGAAW